MKIVLASQSPRRRQLLGQMGLEFTTQSPEIDEAAFQGRDARDLVQILSREKARWIAGQVDPETLVIGADTVVVRDGEILGKPKGEEEARAMLADPLMILVNHTNKMPENYTFETAECGSKTAVNKTLQTEAADAFLAMQAAAAKDGVTIWMQSGYRSVDYQKNLYDKKTQYFRNKGLSEAEAKKQAANIVNPPGYSEHNCGLAADLNSPEHTDLTEGFENTEAFRWLSAHAVEYGFILRYPKNAEAVTEITYEPWHWRYVGPENAALIQQSGLCFEDAVAVLQKLAAGEKITG